MNKRFRVALSFAGEKRPFVSQVARILADRFGEECILYDKFHEADFARAGLAFHLQGLYCDHSDLIVAILCKHYQRKEWCGLEWSAIYGLLKRDSGNEVMLARFDRVEGEGLHGLGGFLELDEKTPEDTARLILERLAINESLPKNHYTTPSSATTRPDWPESAPTFGWGMADHKDAHDQFAQLVTRAAPFRFLPIHGPAGIGKTRLSKQFLGNALKIPDLTCACFDFKGTSDLDSPLRTFAEQLGVAAPKSGTGVSAQLSEIFAPLKNAARPALLIFDTFESAGEAERWVRDSLLLSIVRAPWLRVIVVGRKVPTPGGEAWEDVSAAPVELHPPTPEDWFEYGRAHKAAPGFTLEWVRSLYTIANGKISVIAELCGPNL